MPRKTKAAATVNDNSMAFKRALIERARFAEFSHQLGYAPGSAKREEASKHRTGSSAKTVLTDTTRCALTLAATVRAPSSRSSLPITVDAENTSHVWGEHF